MNFVECHDEPIHIPGYIQSFGYLIGIETTSLTISFFSENISDVFKIERCEDLFGKKLSQFPEVFQTVIDSDIFKDAGFLSKRENETYFDKITVAGKQYHFSVFRANDYIFLEFEAVYENPNKRITNKYDNFYIIDNEQEIWDQLLNTISNIINYDRIMVYKFMSDGSGKVISEKTNNHLESYLGLHYPEHDIPRQARELYKKKRKRIFSDVYSHPVRILSRSGKSIDLTFAASRAMSPIHGQYIKNSGASSSFSISIIIDDQLWGLVTCQNSEPKHIDLEDRVQAGIFTVLASNAYSSFKSKKELEYRIDLNEKLYALKSEFLEHGSLFESLDFNKSELRLMPKADGLAIISDNEIVTDGITPDREIINNIVNWAYENTSDNVFISNSFLKDYGSELNLNSDTAGIIIYFVERSKKEILIWFRKEFDEHINWAGNPEKKIETFSKNGEEIRTVSPRESFQVFTENIKGKSKRWSSKNQIAVHLIRDLIFETSHKQYITIKKLNDQLKKVNEELDSFSYTISHDLGTPLTVMKLNAQMLLNSLGDITDKDKNKINSIIGEIDNMAEMMQNVLQLSRAKHSEIQLETIETNLTIRKITENAKITYDSQKSMVVIKECPEVLADKTMLHQVFLNIINNAVKYSSDREQPIIEIEGTEAGDQIIYRIKDNGIGIPEENKHRMFKIFNRMDNAKKFKGNGVGLSIVHRIMNRLGGNVDYESNKDGTCFILTFQKPKFVKL
ncbi:MULTISPECIES: ATP-binding protein [Chryseobacterium]|uniref:ATP-binding protein n=1 Tax=Chryseobacterium TaxID=59732 RepID=UPI00195D8141|nr:MULTISPECIES: ATP-binding protein [Chryseobacterium]MBM7419285.1 light-regulated signal transduction histidine kinase (bacteriophytochrome) [Chryseobacterium sp. JUb44]MDH6209208.1 chemotaxis family two-component system sensor kinase Cph1 [Chryseobacterium sp. BIGb0186]WSO12053.1 ATP-binding protein [Chryseobacterium scophthalmum]